MTTVEELTNRNADFAPHRFRPELTINPGGDLMVICCVDPRVDPAVVLGLRQGEAAVIRNVGGRVTPQALRTLAMLARVGAANQRQPRKGDWNLVILHHTDCGMTDLAAFPALLAEYFEVGVQDLDEKRVSDPVGSVRTDCGVIHQSMTGVDFLVSGLVYDVTTGLVQVVVPPAPLPVPIPV